MSLLTRFINDRVEVILFGEDNGLGSDELNQFKEDTY
jgi:hypothetical protein